MKRKKFYIDDLWQTFVWCNKCEKFYPINEFYKKKKDSLWVGPCCKKCYWKYIKSWQKNNYDKVQESKQKYRNDNKSIIAKQRKLRREEWKKAHGFGANWLTNKVSNRRKNGWKYPTLCPICWNNKHIEFHHISYESPEMRSIWVFCCKRCHEKIHSWEIKCPESINLLDLI